MRALLFAFVSVLCLQAATVEVRNIGPAVAHAYIKGYSGSCKWNLYQGASATGTPHPDVAGVVDTSRPDTIYDEFGTRIMRLGHDHGDNFLRVNTQYTLAVDAADTGCAGTAPVTFSTYFQPPTVVQRSFIPKWSASTYTKTAEPSYDWTNAGRRKLYVTSPEGVPFEFLDQADVGSWYYTYPYTHGAVGLAGGATWINLGNAANGDSSHIATVSDTTPVVVFPIGSKDWWYSGVFLTYENFGIVLAGSASDGTNVANRQVDFCISFRTVAGTCAATGFTVTLPTGVPQPVLSTPNPGNVPGAQHQAWPNEYTEPGFKGWNTLVTRDLMPVSAGIDPVVNGVVTISSNFTGGNQNYFPYGLEGNYLSIPGSSCPNQMCAVATVETPTHLTLVDKTVNTTDPTTAVGYPFGIVVKRKSATGGSTANIGMKFVEQGNVGDLTFGPTPQCHPTAMTYNGIKGRWCASNRQGAVAPLYFIADDPKDRLSGNMAAVFPNTTFGIQPGYGIGSGPFVTGPKSDLTKNTSIDQPQDRPSGVLYFEPPYGFDPADGNVFYAVNGCNNGASKCVFRLTIRDVGPQYLPLSQYITTVYNGHENTWAVGNVYLENMTPPSKGLDIASQVAGNPEWAWTRQGIYAAYSNFAGANFRGISGTKAFFDILHGQDNAPSVNAVVEMTTGRVIRVFSSAYNGETGGIPEMRFGIFHSANAESVPEETYALALQFPSRGSSAGGGSFAGSPIAVNVVGVMRGGVMSSNTCLGYPYNDTAFCTADNGGTPVPAYDNTCPGCSSDSSIPDWLKQHWTGTDEFVTMDVSKDLCLENQGGADSDAQTYYPVCSWNSAFRKTPWTLQVGDRFTWFAPNAGLWVCATGYAGDCEILQVVKILSQTSTAMRIIVQRDSSFDYSCLTDTYRFPLYPGKTKRPDCVDDITQVKIPNGWRGRIASGRNGGAGTVSAVVKFDSTGCPANKTITCGTYTYGEIPAGIGYGHATVGKGTVPGKYTAVGVKTMLDATFEDLTALDSTKGPVLVKAPQSFNFAGFGFDLINGYAGKDQISAAPHDQLWSLDFNHLNEPNAGGARIGNARGITPIAGCTNVYKVNTANGGAYKISPLLGWAGHNLMEDVSGPSANICTAHDYSFVYIQRAGDTAGLSSGANGVTPAVGDVYIKLPYINRSNDNDGCLMGWHPYLNDPCLVFLKGAGHGGMRRSYWGGHDPAGKFSQFIGYGTGFPGMNRVFSAIHPTASGTTAIAHIGYETQGIRNTGLLFHLPPIRVTETQTNTMFNTTINVPAFPGATHARIRFGFDPNTMYCSGRQEACVTDSVMNTPANPFAYIGETLNPHSCANGCSIPLPLDLGRAFYYQIEWLLNGTVVKSSATRPIVVN